MCIYPWASLSLHNIYLCGLLDSWWIAVHWNVSIESSLAIFESEIAAGAYTRRMYQNYGKKGYYTDCIGREITQLVVFNGIK